MESLDLSPFATTSDLQAALQQSESQSSETVAALGGRMEGVEADLGKLREDIEELRVSY